jgi:hypothetical protein
VAEIKKDFLLQGCFFICVTLNIYITRGCVGLFFFCFATCTGGQSREVMSAKARVLMVDKVYGVIVGQT